MSEKKKINKVIEIPALMTEFKNFKRKGFIRRTLLKVVRLFFQ